MNKNITFLVLGLMALTFPLKAQHYSTHYFTSPLDSTITLIGTFGEIRPDHFHTGIDISTDQQEGKEVHAAADGYVSRIKITAGGFGKALYITHPNGLVTVYGHLQKFREDIQQYVLSAQTAAKSYEIELTPKAKAMQVKKGEMIALSGSTGDVAGPHLHFEIRDAETEEPINPLFFGLPVTDTLAPVISNIRIFPVPGQGILNTTDTAITYVVQREKGVNTVFPNDIVALGQVGFGVEVTDHQQDFNSSLGIYSVQMKIDSVVAYEFKMDRLNFNDLRYANAHIDYQSKMRDNQTFLRCFRLPGNHLKIYGDTTRRGIINFADYTTHLVTIIVKDFSGNSDTVKFQVVSSTSLSEMQYQPVPEGAVLVTTEKGIAIHKSDVDIAIPPGAIYDNYQFLSSESKLYANRISPIYHIGDPNVAVHNPITIGIKPPKALPDSLKSKAAIISIDKYGNDQYEGGTWNEEFLTAKVKSFGNFTIAVDTVAPTIIKEYYPADLNSSRGPSIQFTVLDNLSGLKNYSATVDGKWLLMEYNKKESLIIGDISSFTQNMTHNVVVTVTDEKGNERKFSDTFYY